MAAADDEVERVERDIDVVRDRVRAEVRDDVDGELSAHPRAATAMRMVAAVAHEQSVEQVGLAAAGAAFWLVISAFPTAIAVVSVFGLVVSPERVATDLGDLASAVPGSFGALLTEQLKHVAAGDHAGLSVGLAVSLVLAVWSASAGVYNLDRAVRAAYGLPPQRYLEARARALGGACAVVLLLGIVAVAAGSVIATSSPLLAFGGIVLALAGITVGVAVFYRFSVDGSVAFRSLIPGAVASGLGVVVVTAVFAADVAISSRYTAVYGAFAGVVVAMLAVYLAVYVVLLGAVLNVQRAQRPTTRA